MTELSTYRIVARKAQASAENAEEIEQWKIDHDHANLAWLVNDLYQDGLRLFELLVRCDEAARVVGGEETWIKDEWRTRALKTALRSYRALTKLCTRVGVDSYGYDVSCTKVEQLIALTTAMLKGITVFDAKAHEAALAEAKRGQATTLDELRRRLHDRRS